MANVKSFKVNGETIDVFDKNSVKMISEAEKATLISTGTYKGSVIANNSIFADSSGILYRGNYEAGKQQLASVKSTGWNKVKWMSAVWTGSKFIALSSTNNDMGIAFCAVSTDPEDGNMTYGVDVLDGTEGGTSLAYGNGTLVAMTANISSSNIAIYSTDNGSTWTRSTLPATGIWWKVAYCNDRFIALAANRNYIATSTDGVTWTSVSIPSSASWTDVIYANGYYVISPSNSKTLLYSTDCSNWTSVQLPAYFSSGLMYVDGEFLGIADNSLFASSDLINWTRKSYLPTAVDSLTYANGMFVGMLVYGPNDDWDCITTSTDGVTWTLHEAYKKKTQDTIYRTLVYCGGKFVSFDSENATDTFMILKSQTALLTPLSFSSKTIDSFLQDLPGYNSMPVTGQQKLINTGQFGGFRWVDEEM